MTKEKKLFWIAAAKKELLALSEELKDAFGHALNDVQQGETPSNAKAMKGKLRDVVEIIEDEDGDTFRTMYTVKMEGVVYVLGSFKKKSKSGIATPKQDLDRILTRLKTARQHYKHLRSDT